MSDDSRESIDSLLAGVAGIPKKPVERPTAWSPPAVLDEYRVIQPLGHGGMGSVWLAHDGLLDRMVALKFIAHAEPDQHTRERFALEARAAARLQHENVVSVYRYGEIAGRPYLVSEYIRGDSLDKLAKPVAWQRSLELGVALARGLAAAHRHGIVHRDIKPANAILTAEGDVKLVDFGLAKLGAIEAATPAAFVDPTAATPDAALTAPGAIAGTPRYLAPEVRRGEPASRRSDVYQIGCILYELVVGHAPLFDIASGEPDDPVPPLRVEAAGSRFAAVVDRCLARDAEQRFASGDELREALERIAAPAPGGELPEGNPYRGLVGFESEHRAMFFGRGAEIRAVLERLRADAFVLVAGDSGVGKSSLCRAGVLPHVADGAFADGLAWSAIQLVPGQRPLTALASAVAPRIGADEAKLVDRLRDEPLHLARELRRACGAASGIVLFVDQLEELATIADRAEAEAFGAVLGALASRTAGVRVLATVRGDFLTRIAELPGIGVEISRSLYLLTPLTAEGAREAIVGPAIAKGVRFESDALVDTLVGAVTDASLPLLAFTLARLWDARDQTTHTITAGSLDAIGGVRGALSRHADGVLDALLPAQRAAARKILTRLVTANRTRVRRSADELGAFDRAALDALVRGRLVVARGGDAPTYELVHERLIDGWPALADWLSEANEAIAVHARLGAAVAEWERAARGKDALWGERRLADIAVIPADDLAAAEGAFVAASRRALRRRRLARRAIAIAIPAVLASFYVGARLVARRDLDRHVAENVDEADRVLVEARASNAIANALEADAFHRFDIADPTAEPSWDAARDRRAETRAAYAEAARALEAAYLLDTDRVDLRRRLAAITVERRALAVRVHHPEEVAELDGRLRLYDPDREYTARLTAPARVTLALDPSSATVSDGARELAGTATLAPGSHVLVARAEGRAPVQIPLVLAPDDDRRLAVSLPRAVPSGFVYVPAGTFLYGSRDDEPVRHYFGAAPMHEVATGAYLIGRTEVTYGQWIEFLDDQTPHDRAKHAPGVASSPNLEGGALALRALPGGWELQLTPASIGYSAKLGAPIEYRDREMRARQDWSKLPVSGVSPEDAEAYVGWLARTGRVRGARLCNEVEWERAARGADGRAYPHGDRLAPGDANIDVTYGQRDGGFGPDEVAAHPASTSPFGLADTSGNVWEITRRAVGSGYVTRGGCFFTNAISAHLANRQDITPSFRHVQIGLRICADTSD